MGFNHFWVFVTFQYRGLYRLDMYCTLIIQTWLKWNIHFDCRYLELLNACIFSLVFIVLNVRDGTKSKYPSIVLRGVIRKFAEKCNYIALLLSIAMKIHIYKLPFIKSWLKLKLSKCDVRRMSTRRRCDVISLEPAHLYPWVASQG